MKIVVTGGAGFLGSHLCGKLKTMGHEVFVPRSNDYDLRNYQDVERCFGDAEIFNTKSSFTGSSIDVVFNLAADVGGIGYNQHHPYNLFLNNVKIGINVIDYCLKYIPNVKLIQVGTTCSYPKYAYLPFKTACLWDGYPEETNAPYGLAKKMLLVQLQSAHLEYGFNGVYVIPTNLYGPGDNFNLETSHVIPALISKFHQAKECLINEVTLWGTGRASRDFLFVEDAVNALVLALNYQRAEPLNVGSGKEINIMVLADIIKEVIGFEGRIIWDSSKPDGQPRRVLDIKDTKHALGWSPAVDLKTGIKLTYDWFLKNAPKN